MDDHFTTKINGAILVNLWRQNNKLDYKKSLFADFQKTSQMHYNSKKVNTYTAQAIFEIWIMIARSRSLIVELQYLIYSVKPQRA